MGFLKKVAGAGCIEASDAAALLCLDRKRKKKTSNKDSKSQADHNSLQIFVASSLFAGGLGSSGS
jgi:hypothetical protein